MRKFLTQLENKIKTKSDLIFYLENIDLAMEMIMKSYNEPLSEKLKKSSLGYLGNILLEISSEKSFQETDQKIFLLELLKKHILFLQQVKLEISFHPNEEVIDKIRDWFEKEIGEKVIIDLIINPSVVGGAIIEYDGKAVDFSIAKEIKKMEIKIPN